MVRQAGETALVPLPPPRCKLTSLFVRAARDLEALTEDEIGQLSDDEITLLRAHYDALLIETMGVVRRRHGLPPLRVPGVSEGRLREICSGIASGKLALVRVPLDEWALITCNDAQSAAIDRAIIANADADATLHAGGSL